MRFLTGSAVAMALLLAPLLAGTASAAPPTSVPRDISKHCGGQNAEVYQATWRDFAYEAWMGCGGIGFTRSADDGRTWSTPVTLSGSANGWDPALTTAPDGTLYVGFMQADSTFTFPVIVASFDQGRTFRPPVSVKPPDQGNWGDRDFIAAGPHGLLYLTWDYGVSAASVTTICSAGGSCAFATGQLNVVVQKSADYGRTWSSMTPVSPGFPASGGDSAPMVIEPNGRIDLAYQGYNIYDLRHYAMTPATMFFTSSTDGGRTWTAPAQVGAAAGTMSLAEWWIDGAIGMDSAGDLYITWDTQNDANGIDAGWLSYSTHHGRSWSAPIRVSPDTDSAPHITQVTGGPAGIAYVGWLSSSSPRGYAEYLRTFSVRSGWRGAPVTISRQYGNPGIWPGDTFGISLLRGGRLMLSWGSAVGGSPNAEIFAVPVNTQRVAT